MENVKKNISADMSGNILDIKDLAVSFDVYGLRSYVLDGINFTVKKGQRVGLVGESGCGKTTTLKAILRVLAKNGRIDSGDIEFEGNSIYGMKADKLAHMRQTGVGMIFQDPSSALNPVFTVESQFLTALKYAYNKTKTKSELQKIAIEALESVMLPDPERIMSSYPFQLSGGMRQRVCIAITIAAGRKVLLADEPGTSLDVTIQDQILRLINKLVEEKDLSVIMVSHSLGVIRETTDIVNIMYAGSIVESGKTDDVFHNPKHPYTIALMKCVPKLTGEGVSEGIPGRVPDYQNPPKGCRFAPRCPRAKEKCFESKPPETEVSSGHFVCCYGLMEE